MFRRSNSWRSPLGLGVAVASLFTLSVTQRVEAHGVSMEYQSTEAIEVQGTYDSGEPMKDAQVAVFAPDDPSTPWLTGTTNEQGIFLFQPDPAKPGTWEVQFRQAGHGDILTIPLGDETLSQVNTVSGGTGRLTLAQKLLVFAAMTWGFVGTALYFLGRKHQKAPIPDSDLQSTTSQS